MYPVFFGGKLSDIYAIVKDEENLSMIILIDHSMLSTIVVANL